MTYHASVLQVGPGTPAGRVLRRYWQPVAVSAKLENAHAQQLRILGEDLVLYRGATGQPHLVGARCSHRQSWLHTGWIEEDCIRCFYHGWKFDGLGQCLERPPEQARPPDSSRIRGYPLHEYAGLIFAFMGSGTPPEFPHFPALEEPNVRVVSGIRPPGVWPINYFQMIENDVDPAHTAFVHRESEPHWHGVPEVSAKETSYGIEVTAKRPEYERKTYFHFPNLLNLTVFPNPGENLEFPMYLWVVPLDDDASMFISALAFPANLADRISAHAPVPGRTEMTQADAADILAGRRRPRSVTEEDYVALVGQGTVANREDEVLGRSDVAIVMLRRQWARALDDLETFGLYDGPVMENNPPSSAPLGQSEES